MLALLRRAAPAAAAVVVLLLVLGGCGAGSTQADARGIVPEVPVVGELVRARGWDSIVVDGYRARCFDSVGPHTAPSPAPGTGAGTSDGDVDYFSVALFPVDAALSLQDPQPVAIDAGLVTVDVARRIAPAGVTPTTEGPSTYGDSVNFSRPVTVGPYYGQLQRRGTLRIGETAGRTSIRWTAMDDFMAPWTFVAYSRDLPDKALEVANALARATSP